MRFSGGAPFAEKFHSNNGPSSAAISRRPSRHFHRISFGPSLSVVLRPKAQIDFDVSQSSEVRSIEQMDGRILDADEVLVEERPDESRPDVVHGHSAA